MRMVVIAAALAGIGAASLWAQEQETQQIDSRHAMRVETARDHLTVIEVADPVTMVAVGNPGAFAVERREDRVFIKPVQDDARTNLFIWTSAGRHVYELVPAAGVEQMHFAIDQLPVVQRASLQNDTPDETPTVQELPARMLTDGTPILVQGERETRDRVEVMLRDLYRDGERIYLRYALINHSNISYQPAQPTASRLGRVRSRTSLIGHGDRQLGERLVRKLEWDTAAPIDVLNAEQSPHVEARGQGTGWLILEEQHSRANDQPILRLRFAADHRGTVEAVLVLDRITERREVANALCAPADQR